MRAYWKGSVYEFLNVESHLIQATIQERYSQDGFASLYPDYESRCLVHGGYD